MLKTYESCPGTFENLLAIEGVGPQTIRALSLIGEIVYGAKPSFKDPAKYSFAHGGKDGIPYPVNREGYEQSIQFLTYSIKRAKIDNSDKYSALKKLAIIDKELLNKKAPARSNN
jgi:hypothetical protein